MVVYNFKKMASVPPAEDLIDIILTRTQVRDKTLRKYMMIRCSCCCCCCCCCCVVVHLPARSIVRTVVVVYPPPHGGLDCLGSIPKWGNSSPALRHHALFISAHTAKEKLASETQKGRAFTHRLQY